MIDFIYNWQTLFGAAIGAATPVLFYFFTQFLDRKSKEKESLVFLEKEIANAINNLKDIKDTLETFCNENLSSLKSKIEKSNGVDAYSGEVAYLPRFNVYRLDNHIKHTTTFSGYLSNELLRVFLLSEELFEQMIDARNQFDDTTSSARKLAFNKINSPTVHNNTYIANLESYEKMVKDQIISKNFRTYLKALTRVHVIVMELNSMGEFRWKFKFSHEFRLFLSKKSLKGYKEKRKTELMNILSQKLKKNFWILNPSLSLTTSLSKSFPVICCGRVYNL